MKLKQSDDSFIQDSIKRLKEYICSNYKNLLLEYEKH